jgi:hypothetical protein
MRAIASMRVSALARALSMLTISVVAVGSLSVAEVRR